MATPDLNNLAQVLSSLAYRWKAESMFENFADYEKAITEALPEGATFMSLTKRPFRVVFSIDGQAHFLKVHRNQILGGTVGPAMG